MAPTGRSELLTLVEEQDVDGLFEIIKMSKSKKDFLNETVSELSKNQLEDLWEKLHSACINTFLSSEENKPNVQNEEQSQTEKVILCVTTLAQASLASLRPGKKESKETGPLSVPPSLLEAAILLHGIMPTLTAEQEHIKNRMSSLFEEWWHYNFIGRKELMNEMIIYLLARSTHSEATQNDVIRVWTVHDVLSDLSLTGDSGLTIISVLMQCVHHPQYITTSQGIMFLGYIFTLNPEVTAKLHQAVKNHLYAAPRSWCAKYGEIYFRAWQKSSGEMQESIEVSCIQDFMYRAVHASRHHPQSVSIPMFELLSFIHKQKIQRGVEEMLTRLYEPILWRSLRVTNSDVRFNAVSLLFDVFPLQNSTMDHERVDMELQKQFDIIHGLLTDPVQEIRVISINGVGTVLNLYWELIPSQVIQCLVTVLVQDLAHDSTSARVREAVIKVLFKLCDNHLCIPVLKKVLPEFKNFIHDSSEMVRTAMCDLLLKVKTLRPIKFWNVVPVEHLLARLEGDSPVIVRRIMKLIHSSFVPINATPAEQIEKCVYLISQNREATRQFFMNVCNNLGVESTTKYIIVLCKYVLESSRQIREKGECSDRSNIGDQAENVDEVKAEAAPVNKRRKKKEKKNKKGKKQSLASCPSPEESVSAMENQENRSGNLEDVDVDPSLTMDIFSGIVEAIYLMYISLAPQLGSEEHKPLKEGLVKKLSVTVRELMNKFKDASLRIALISLAGYLPSRYLPLMSSNLLNSLKEGTPFAEKHVGETATIIKFLIQSGKTEDLFETMITSIDQKLKIEAPIVVGKETKKARKGVAFAEEKSYMDISEVIYIASHMFSQAECRQVLQNNKEHVFSLAESLMAVMKHLDLRHGQLLTFSDPLSKDVVLQIFSLCLRCVTFLNAHANEDDEKDSHFIESILTKAAEFVQCMQDAEEDAEKQDFVAELTECVMKMCKGLIMVGRVDGGHLQLIFSLCEQTLSSIRSLSLMQNTLSTAYQFTQLRTESDEADRPTEAKTPEQAAIACFRVALGALMERQQSNDTKVKRKKTMSAAGPALTELIGAMMEDDRQEHLSQRWCEMAASYIINEMKVQSENGSLETETDKSLILSGTLISAFKARGRSKRMMMCELTKRMEFVTNVHSLDGLVTVIPWIGTKDSDLFGTVQRALQRLSPGEMDEDIFRDVKAQIERKMQVSTTPAHETRSRTTRGSASEI